MWADAAVTARLVVRPSGLAGVVAALAGLAAARAAAEPWHEVALSIRMLGGEQARVLEEVAAVAVPWAVLAAAAGLVATVLGTSLALDRHPGWTRPVLVGSAGSLLVAGVVPLLLPPPLARLGDPAGALEEVAALGSGLPSGVSMALSVRPGAAPVVAAGAAVVVLGATLAARELSTR